MTDDHNKRDKGWAEKTWFRNLFLALLVIAAIAAVVAGFVPEWRNEHPHFAAEGVLGFFAGYGFVAFMFIVLAGQHLRKLVGRKEDYYEDRE